MILTSEILNQKITEIYYSASYSDAIFTVFIELSNGRRFRLSGYGISSSEKSDPTDDLYPINIDEAKVARKMFIGHKIREFVPAAEHWSYLVLENNMELGVCNDALEKCFNIGAYCWKPNRAFLLQSEIAPTFTGEYGRYQPFINFFQQKNVYSNFEVFDHLDILNPLDKICILEILIKKNIEQLPIYTMLCESYIKLGDKDKAYDLADTLFKNKYTVFGYEALRSLYDLVERTEEALAVTTDFQYKYIQQKLREVKNPLEKQILQLLKYFIQNKKTSL